MVSAVISYDWTRAKDVPKWVAGQQGPDCFDFYFNKDLRFRS